MDAALSFGFDEHVFALFASAENRQRFCRRAIEYFAGKLEARTVTRAVQFSAILPLNDAAGVRAFGRNCLELRALRHKNQSRSLVGQRESQRLAGLQFLRAGNFEFSANRFGSDGRILWHGGFFATAAVQ